MESINWNITTESFSQPSNNTEAHTQSGQQTSTGKLSCRPQNRDTAIYFDRSGPRLSGVHLARPPPEPPQPEDKIGDLIPTSRPRPRIHTTGYL